MQIIVYEKPGSDICAAFITNNHTKTPKTINFRGSDYILPPRSISILPDCKSLVFNTQMVTYFNVYYPLCYKQRIHILGLLKPLPPQSSQLTNLHCLKKKKKIVSQHNTRNFEKSKAANNHKWEVYSEPIPTTNQLPSNKKLPAELYSLLKDTTDYGWYTTR